MSAEPKQSELSDDKTELRKVYAGRLRSVADGLRTAGYHNMARRVEAVAGELGVPALCY